MTTRVSDQAYARTFWGRVRIGSAEACWPYLGPAFADGYGRHYSPATQAGDRAHRIAYRLASGTEIPDGLLVCHTCDNPPCCNPAHLFLGTVQDNFADMHAKKRCYHHRNPNPNPRRRRPAGLPFFFAGIALRLDRESEASA